MSSSAFEYGVLHLLGVTPGSTSWQTALAIPAATDAVVLWQNSVSAVLIEKVYGEMLKEVSAKLYVYMPDLQARSLHELKLRSVKPIQDADLVELACYYRSSHTWF